METPLPINEREVFWVHLDSLALHQVAFGRARRSLGLGEAYVVLLAVALRIIL